MSNNPKQKFSKLLKSLPGKPGVYKMLNKGGDVIYVGKAKGLKKRVNQYFQKSKDKTTKTQKLVENIENIDYTVVDTELEALILELNLIKELRPKYNVLLKDDKNYVYIKITEYEDFPRIQVVRKIDDKKATYFGPKTAKHKVDKTFKTLKKVLPFRHCNLDIEAISDKEVHVTKKTIKYPCLDYYIKRCCAPCISNCNKKQYREIIDNVKSFLEGRHEDLVKNLRKQMATLAQSRDFEKAAKLRDRIKNIEEITERQKISDPNRKDTDIFNATTTNGKAFFNLFQIRDGKLINQENFISKAPQEDEQEIFSSFLLQYYEKTTNIPKEVLIPVELEDASTLGKFISDQKGSKVTILNPKRGEKNKLLNLSLKNAKIFADRNKTSWQEEGADKQKTLKELKKLLKLKEKPQRIECYDISHLSGEDTVGSMIVFEKGVPAKDMYRKFKIRTVSHKPDDYKSLEEVITRRFKKLKLEMNLKDFKFKKDKKQNQYYLQDKKKNIVGTINALEINEKIAEISNLFVDKAYRGKKLGYVLITEAISKIKAKRIYIACKKELATYYEKIGFEEIKTIPKELEKKSNATWYAADKSKFKKDKSFSKIPDLIIIDGGKGQLSSAIKALKKLNLKLPTISIAKKEEEIFTPGRTTSIKLDKTNEILKLIQRSRDEAHRFAITYNKKLRQKKLKA
ncbi:excinuclease ABC subunit UvrC [Candidatus Peregrinibacteria bacterium]|jgi:excinuclease ABC subunit C|nr:excinuclease ABC subunit UvrC [Candidatus Peregrinibacteria bacterium]MBT4148307.1 excinuclease ABC subunit UvrC [Candidatus Peregrinibacteria bacterium]MBT4366412.1 excinuclease ABC subunit UvrC [Candidatus Peregrinibacteria bacterium]MBT4455940.1 excinuclease ABC subunit UvrC [Candidatus Peregrinibacteria bacterium]